MCGSAIRGDHASIEVSLEVQPARRQGRERVAELVQDPDKQIRRVVDGFRQVMKRVGLVGG